MDTQKALDRLRQIGDFVVQHQLATGELDIEHGSFIFPAGYNMRALAAIYKLTGNEQYLHAILRWTDRVFDVQNADGSFYADTISLEECYGRFASDASNGLNVVFNILPYLDEQRLNRYLDGLERFSEWVLNGEEGKPFIHESGAIGCGVYKGDEKNLQGRGRNECLECTAITLCTFLTPYYRLTHEARGFNATVRGVEYILSHQNPDGTYNYISKGFNTDIAGKADVIVHVLHYVTEGLVYFHEHSGIEFFDPLASRVRQSMKESVRWLIDNQLDNGMWAPLEAGNNNVSKNAGLVMPLVWLVDKVGQEESFRSLEQGARGCIERACEFLLSEQAVTEYGVLRNVRENAFAGIALAEAIRPGLSLEMVVPEALVKPDTAKAEMFPLEILEKLPRAKAPFEGVEGWVHGAENTQIVFWRSQQGCYCEDHSHPYAEWCILISGYTEVTVDGMSRTYRPGDTLFIPAGVVHSARTSENYRSIDIFASPDHIATQS